MKEFTDKVAIVTGAGSGIGRALAQQLSQLGAKLAISDVNEQGLAETANSLKGESYSACFDVADEQAFNDFAQSVHDKWGQVDLIVNNAGVALLQSVQDMQRKDMEWLMGINFWGVINGTHAALPYMLEQDSGVIVNISSLYGLVGWPGNTAYCAAKFGVRGYTEAMQQDLRGTGVTAISVHPGGIKTNIVRNARVEKTDNQKLDKATATRSFDKVAMTSPEKAASIIINGIRKKKARVVVGQDAKLIDWLARKLPIGHRGIIASLNRQADKL